MANEITQDGAAKIFLTGATGAVGRAAVRQFAAAGYRVIGATSGVEGAKAVRADGGIPAFPDLLRAGELRSAILAAEADVVINLAPQHMNHAVQGNGEWDLPLLTEGTAALVEAATAAGVKFIVHTSFVFADGEDEAAGALLDAARTSEQLTLGSSVPACVLRFGFVYGAYSPELLSIRNALKMGRTISAGNARAHANWIHAGDAAAAVVLAAQKQPADAILTIVDGHPASPVAFLNYFAESQGLTRPTAGSRMSLNTLLGNARVDVAAIHVHADNTEAKEVLDWSPRFADYRQGIDDLLLSWRAEGG